MNVRKLIEQRAKTKVTKEKAELTLTIAAIYSEQGSHDSALVEYKKYLEIWESKDDNLQCAIANRYIAECYIEMGDFTQAIIHTNRYLQLSTLVNNKIEQQRAFVTLGRCFLNRVETLKDGVLITKSLKSANQALLNSIKLIKELSGNLDDKNSAEMRAISLLNLGHVQRAQHVYNDAFESFSQCITLARKYNLQKILFRASYQLGEMLINNLLAQTFINSNCPIDHFEQFLNQPEIIKALQIVQSTLSSPLSKPCVDNEAKLLCINLKELFAQIYLCHGHSRKAIKIFRLLKVNCPNSSEQYSKMIKIGYRLMNLLNDISNTDDLNTKNQLTFARIHEKLGDLYAGIDLHGCAVRHYRLMLEFSELAYKQHQSTESTTTTTTTTQNELIKLIDAALISIAETYRTLGYYTQCVEMYKREILWSTSIGLSMNDIITSWLSLAQAQRLISTNQPPSIIDNTKSIESNQKTHLNDSTTALDSLLSAYKASKSIGSMSLISDCLKELIDYYEQYNYKDELDKARKELKKIIEQTPNNDGDQGENNNTKITAAADDDDGEEEEEAEAGDSDDDDANDALQFLETLSSDSELEQCIGKAELMDEFHDTMKGKKSGKALCLKTNMKGETPLHVATINGDMNHVVKLIEVLGHPVNVRDGAGWLPIHEAAFHDRTDIAIYLLDHGAQLDDTGCPDDCSTPLFEAIHNGALASALIFVNRGANLWHKNKQGEHLSNLLDQWEPTRHACGTFAEQRTKFNKLLAAIKSRLGDDYDRWCNLKQETPEKNDYSSSSSSDNDESVSSLPSKSTSSANRRKSYSNRSTSSRSSHSFALNDTSSALPSITTLTQPKSTNRKSSLRTRNWDDLMVDLDEDEHSRPVPPLSLPSSSSSSVKLKKSMNNAVESYKEAMKAIGGSSKTRSVDKRQSLDNNGNSMKRRKKSNLINADDDDGWLVLDEKPKGSRSVSSTVVKEHFDTLNVMKHGKSTGSSKNRFDLADLEFSPHKAFTSTQNDHLTSCPPGPSSSSSSSQLPSKCTSTPIKQRKQQEEENKPIDRLLSSSKDSSIQKIHCLPSSTTTTVDHQFKLGKLTTNEHSETTTTTTTYSVKVAFSDISVLVPVDSLSRSVSWLANEAYRRRQILMGFNSSNLPPPSVHDPNEPLIRLSTKDQALLLPSDRLFSILPNLSQSGSMIEFLAEFNESNAVVTQKISTNLPNHCMNYYDSKSKEEPPPQTTSPLFQSILEKARNMGIVDLSNLSINDIECCKLLSQLNRTISGGVRVITDVQLQGNSLTTNILDRQQFTSMNSMINLTEYLCQISLQLVRLNLSMNLLNEQFFNRFLCTLSKQFNKEDKSSGVLMPRLQYFDLSYNSLLGGGYGIMKRHNLMIDNDGDSQLLTNQHHLHSHWIIFIENCLKAFPKLTHLNLAGCSLGAADLIPPKDGYDGYRKESLCRSFSTDSFVVSCLSELDLSWNPQITPQQLSCLLSLHCLNSLKCLRLRGCSTYYKFSSMHQHHHQCYPFQLPISTFDLTLFEKSLNIDPMIKKRMENFNQSSSATIGDQLLIAVCDALIKGNIRLQLLDMGHCQLTHHCLNSLKNLFGTPGTSITSLLIDHNPMLSNVIVSNDCPFPSWIQIIQAITQPASALVSLTIDLPQIPDNDLNALTVTINSIEAKLSPTLSSTPLQELSIIISNGTVDDWTNEDTFNYQNQSIKCRFFRMLSNLFTKRFGKLIKITRKNHSVTFSIL
ncbi:unnamed protein product [Schistosoma turkestanicum]|nr:unnamed protein product [Schistosoma turkestanicum]